MKGSLPTVIPAQAGIQGPGVGVPALGDAYFDNDTLILLRELNMDIAITDQAQEWIRAKGGAAVVDMTACST